MSIAELQDAVRQHRLLFVPTGCIESHGNHLPLGTDTIIAEAVAAGVATRFDSVIAPTIDYGPTGYAVSGPDQGTVDVSADAFYGYVRGALAGLVRLGFAHVFIVVHHQGTDGPTAASFHFAQAALFNELHQVRGLGWWGAQRPEPWPIITVLPTIAPGISDEVGDHAGQTETSLILYLRPELVDLRRLQPNDYWYTWESDRRSETGTAELGRERLELMVESVANAVQSAL
jgi:creatinine amidohydrolase